MRYYPSAFVALAALLLYAPAAFAYSSPNKQKSVQSISEYNHPQYTAEKHHLGSFEVSAKLDIDETYNDNIFASENNRVEDLITTMAPSAEIESNWNRHALSTEVHGKFGLHADNDGEDFEDYGTKFSTRIDVMRNAHFSFDANFDARHEGRGEPNTATNSIEPTQIYNTRVKTGYVHAPGRLSLSATADFKIDDFKNGRTAAAAVIDNNLRDLQELKGTARIGYTLYPGYSLFVRSSFTDVTYDETASQSRDSDELRVVSGMDLDLGGSLKGEAFGGYLQRTYRDSTIFKNFYGETYGGNLLWNINRISSIQWKLSRTAEETVDANSSTYINTSTKITLQHELRRNIMLEGSAGYQGHEYIGHIAQREDDNFSYGAKIRYLPNKRLAVTADYGYTERDSNTANNSFYRNTAKLRLSVFF